ncbi:hypothetical protein KUCAC02_025142 [Chaenocephalus aceratus]|nr:hypothetical protein KUCAC02_025142 [Chaenocephalus aceratus]
MSASERDRAPSDTSVADTVPIKSTGKRPLLGAEDVSAREPDRGSARVPVKSVKKRRLVASERDPAPSNPTEPHVFSFPGLDFGLRAMDKEQLKHALIQQFRLHNTTAANATWTARADPKGLTARALANYQNHRLAAVSWIARVTPRDSLLSNSQHSVLLPAVNLMDRYVAACAEAGEDPSRLLENMGNIRAACLALSVKMYAVHTYLTLGEIHVRNEWANEACVTESSSEPGAPGFNPPTPSNVQAIGEAERRLCGTLKGSLFPVNVENTIGLLCRYLILELLSSQPSSYVSRDWIQKQAHATRTALCYFTKTALDVKLLRFEWWKCVAESCYLGVFVVCIKDSIEGLCVERSLMSLLEELTPGEFTFAERSDLQGLLVRDCVVCSGVFVNLCVRNSLRTISSKTCTRCGADPVERDTILAPGQ